MEQPHKRVLRHVGTSAAYAGVFDDAFAVESVAAASGGAARQA